MADQKHGFIYRIVEAFLRGNLSAIVIVLALALGAVALLVTPREEEPQIVVPLADVLIEVPGASAREVERQVATRLEKLLYQIDGVEYVYSMSMPNRAVVTVRFFVGEDREDSLVKLQTKLAMHADRVPSTVAGWVVKPVEIDDVPIVNVTLYSERYSGIELRRIAEELESRLQAVRNTGPTRIVGGRPRQVRIEFDPERLTGRGLTIADIERAVRGANLTVPAGSFQQLDREHIVDAGVVLRDVEEVAELVIGVADDRPVYLRDVADVRLDAAEVETYTHFGYGPAAGGPGEEEGPAAHAAAETGRLYPAVTIAVAKRKGSNAVWVSRAVQEEVERLAPILLPDGVEYRVTRDYGQTANDKVNELVEALAVAIVIVVALLALVMGWREGLIVATAVPLTFALTLVINYLAGYTINRVTLFALILALGLVVDDPIVDVENIYRHFKMRKEKPLEAVLTAVNEVRPPIILATLAVIVSFVPMFFITGMMGPYMRPMALNVPLAMLMSLLVAFTITPWMAYHVLKREYGKADEKPFELRESGLYRAYSRTMRPFLKYRSAAWGLLLFMFVLFLLSCTLAATRRVPLKMLPFDNKNELQVVVDMPEGTTLQRTAAVTAELAGYLQTVNEVTDVTTFVGTNSPMDFNGMVRHYYMRSGPNVADIRMNFLEKRHREQQSHEIGLRIRDDLHAIAARSGANIKIVESPPGPPVLSTLAVEVYGEPYHEYADIQDVARIVEDRFCAEPGVVDVDTTAESEQTKYIFVTDKEKAALAGLSTADITHTLSTALDGSDIAVCHQPNEVTPTAIHLRLRAADRSELTRLKNLYLAGPEGNLIQLGELGSFVETVQDQTIYRKNLRRVVYVTAEMAGRPPAEAIIDMHGELAPGGEGSPVSGGFEIEWAGEGEWKITVDVFRDLGLAFGAACLGIYVLLVYQTGSYFMPVILMISIPLTIIGIMPGFWLLNLLWDQPIGSYANPVFFTATAMIGMIALSGIAVRNAILLIDFIHGALREGAELKQAILDSGAVRFRPIFLTAGTAMLAALPITLDPIFSGLAWALIFGLFVSTAFTLVVIPVVYWMVYRNRKALMGRTMG
ncbi:MAG: efflux RND transporter permease subunit [Planctomycetota bacterium]|nr:efflux RND transporter permease subunit [Planctomycetota bacterium]